MRFRVFAFGPCLVLKQSSEARTRSLKSEIDEDGLGVFRVPVPGPLKGFREGF